MSAGVYSDLAEEALTQVRSQGRTPILVGGTGFYLRALLGGLAPIPSAPQDMRDRLLGQWMTVGPRGMHARLAEVDPDYAGRIHHNDRQRVLRALEVYQLTGESFSSWHAKTGQGGAFGLPEDRFAPGQGRSRQGSGRGVSRPCWLQAPLKRCVRPLRPVRPRTLPASPGIGCAELAAHLRGELSLEDAQELVVQEHQGLCQAPADLVQDPSPTSTGSTRRRSVKWWSWPGCGLSRQTPEARS